MPPFFESRYAVQFVTFKAAEASHQVPSLTAKIFRDPASANWTQSRAPTERPTRSSAKSRIQ
ncbi:hypothetical protein AGR6A_pAt60011 [Agrobacterium sp. NCPPB 925]|nr:hypothetical protein AGR6A_pAt60011 [Agrobacterium sp. NCPPB 925]